MDKQQFQIIKQHIGIKLLNYILNSDEITESKDYGNYAFTNEQKTVLDDLSKILKEIQIHQINQEGFGNELEYYLNRIDMTGQNIFNHYRILSGGAIKTMTDTDKLLEFLVNIFYREYPKLILKSSNTVEFHYFNVSITNEEYTQISNLIKEDDIDKITNKKYEPKNEYSLTFTTDNQLCISAQISILPSTIITRSFQNACNKMHYSQDDIIEEIKFNLALLRNLANDEMVEYSTFIGIKGLIFEGFNEIDFNGACLRQLDYVSNPSIHTHRIAMKYSDKLSGHVFEIKHTTKIRDLEPTYRNTTSGKEYEVQNKIIEALKFAIAFTLNADTGFTQSFTEPGFPLIQVGNYSTGEKRNTRLLTIEISDLNEIQEWFNYLIDIDLDHVRTPLKRLAYAIERSNSEDAIVDAIIAWEGMFSEAFETTFKVTGSITKYLRDTDREEFLSRLKKLYNLRSEIVHGASSKLLDKEDINDLRAEVISIGLACFSKLLKDKILLKMLPAERVKYILVFK